MLQTKCTVCLPMPLLIMQPRVKGQKTWWCHRIETFSRYWPSVSSPVNSLHKGLWRGALMCSLICSWTNSWANHRDTCDLRRHYPHYDVIVMNAVVSYGFVILCGDVTSETLYNTLRSRHNGCHSLDDIRQFIFLYGNFWIFIQILLFLMTWQWIGIS